MNYAAEHVRAIGEPVGDSDLERLAALPPRSVSVRRHLMCMSASADVLARSQAGDAVRFGVQSVPPRGREAAAEFLAHIAGVFVYL